VIPAFGGPCGTAGGGKLLAAVSTGSAGRGGLLASVSKVAATPGGLLAGGDGLSATRGGLLAIHGEIFASGGRPLARGGEVFARVGGLSGTSGEVLAAAGGLSGRGGGLLAGRGRSQQILPFIRMLFGMTEHLRDPDLDRLVRELNEKSAKTHSAAALEGDGASDLVFEPVTPAAAAPDILRLRTPDQALVAEGGSLDTLLAAVIQQKASDLLLISGLPPIYRINGRLVRMEDHGPLEGDEVGRMFQVHLGTKERQDLEERGSTDFSLSISRGRALDEGIGAAWRFRVNVHRQRGELSAAVRALPSEIPTLSGLNLPPSLAELIKPSRGLVLVCGPTGSGKSSTLAALVGEINRTRTSHILTIEDPIEYEHRSIRSAIEHIEVGRDARSFHEALRAALRQDPDVILVGEMRDLETVATALTAAETGHLVLSTLHTNDAQQAVHRIVDVFPPAQQSQIRHQLALALHAIVVQTLVPRADGKGRVPAIELLLASYPVRHHIRSDNLQKLYNEITLGKRQGMITMEESLAQLVQNAAIDIEEARMRASHPEAFESLVRG